MFIVETKSSRAARKMSFLMAVALLLLKSFGGILTMHFYVNPKPPAPPGFRFLGFPRSKQRGTAVSYKSSKRLIEFAKTNSGALIIGVALIIGLNFSRFLNYAEVAFYHLSGQAGADKAASEAAYAEWAADQERQRIAQAAANERTRIEQAAWQEFLSSERTKFSQQIRVVKNSYGGDYLCLGNFSLPMWAEDAASYEVRDNMADEFVKWLNSNGLLDRRDWKYDDIKGYANGSYSQCWSARSLWRANRYQKRID